MSDKVVLIYSMGPMTPEVASARADAEGSGGRVGFRNPSMFGGADATATDVVVFGAFPEIEQAYQDQEPPVQVKVMSAKAEAKAEAKPAAKAPPQPAPQAAAPDPTPDPKTAAKAK